MRGNAESTVTRYPERLLKLLEGRQPFAADNSFTRHDLLLKPLRDSRRGFYGVGAQVNLATLGERLLLVDTAARGLLLKSRIASDGELHNVPEWIQSGPGIQSGIFRILPAFSWGNLSLSPVLAELFSGAEFPWVDGILSTEVFSPWVVRLDPGRHVLTLFPPGTHELQSEWPASLNSNWWVVQVEIGGEKAHMLLDTGADRTFLAESWVAGRSDPRRKLRKVLRNDGYLPAGEWKVSLNGEPAVSRPMLIANAAALPVLPDKPLHGVLGFDILRDYRIDLDYPRRKLFLQRGK